MSDARPALVLTNERDYAADRVIDLLHSREVPVQRWNAETLGDQVLSWSPHQDSPPFRSVWFRQYLAEPTLGLDVAALDEQLVIKDQWRSWVAALDDGRTAWVNPLWAARQTENKVVQLRRATALGLPVPATLVTANRDTAADFAAALPTGRAIVKSLASAYFAHSDQSFMFTERLTDDLLQSPQAWAHQPVIVQQQIPRSRDIRVLVVDDYVSAASLDYDAQAEGEGTSDWRLAPGRDWAPFALDQHERDRCRALAQSLGLRYAAIDLVDDGETRWFLELNQAGEFEFLDRPLGLGVAEHLATALGGAS